MTAWSPIIESGIRNKQSVATMFSIMHSRGYYPPWVNVLREYNRLKKLIKGG